MAAIITINLYFTVNFNNFITKIDQTNCLTIIKTNLNFIIFITNVMNQKLIFKQEYL